MPADANLITRYLFHHHLSRSLRLEPPLPTPPELELTLDITHFSGVICLTPSGSAYFDRQVVAREERIDRITSTRGLLSHVPELPLELHPCWEESISSYVCGAMEGVEAGRVRVVVRVEVVRETAVTDDDDGRAEEQSKEGYAVPTVMIESSLEEIAAEDRDDEGGCAVCLEEFRSPEGGGRAAVRVLRCSHVFHRECVLEWLASHPSCPLCRSEISGFTKIKMLMVMMYTYFLMVILASILE